MNTTELLRLLDERGIRTTHASAIDDAPGEFLVFLVYDKRTSDYAEGLATMPEFKEVERRHNRFIYRVVLA